MKNLADVPSGARIFVDTNIFVLHYKDQGKLGQTCRDFLLRTAVRELQGFTSASIVAETIHRVILAEATNKLSLSSRETLEFLQKHPQVVRELNDHLKVASDIHRQGINILPITYKDLHNSKRFRSHFGLMTNDSLVVAVMQTNKLYHLATNDASFDRVSGIQVWGPTGK